MSSKQEKAVQAQQNGKPYLERADIVVVGNGIAGLTAAVEARRHAPDKRIVIITDQIHPTINTPALKQFAIGKVEREQLLAYPAGTERLERIHIVTSRVEEIHARSKYITLSGKRSFGYEQLLLATGSTPTGLSDSIPGRNFDGVLTLHRLQDYLDLRRRLQEVSDAVVIGGGVHAIETVMGLLYWGIRVHWLIRGTSFMARIIDQPASAMVLQNIQRAGAQIYTETEVVGVVGRVGVVAGVITNQQKMIPCQLVLSCTGTQASLELAKQCSMPLKLGRGIQVDDQLRTGVPNIFAAGDVAALKNPQTGSYEPRAQWYAAVAQGRIAGAMLTEREDLALQPFGVHWHATHLGELSMLTVGEPLKEEKNVTVLTDQSGNDYRRLALLDDRLVGYLALGSAQPDSLAIKRIIDEGYSVRPILRELLKGRFDARRYLAEQQSKNARGIVTTRKLPELAPVAKEEPRLPNTGEQAVLPAAQQASGRTTQRETGPLQEESLVAQTRFEQESIHSFSGKLPELSPGATRTRQLEQESIHSFSGKLPELSAPATTTDDWLVEELPRVRPTKFVTEDVNAFTGKLPDISNIYVREVPSRRNEPEEQPQVAPIRPAFPTPSWNTGQMRKLRSYIEEEPPPTPKERPARSRGLLAYGEQDKPNR